MTDHCAGIDTVLRKGTAGEVYNVGAGNEINTIVLAKAILEPAREAREPDDSSCLTGRVTTAVTAWTAPS